MKRDDATLLDIARAARLVVQFASETDAESFPDDDLVQSAALHQLLVIGEATKRLGEDFRVQHSHIPWRQIAGMQNRPIHGYDTVDLDLVWETVTHDVPTLLEHLGPLLPPEGGS